MPMDRSDKEALEQIERYIASKQRRPLTVSGISTIVALTGAVVGLFFVYAEKRAGLADEMRVSALTIDESRADFTKKLADLQAQQQARINATERAIQDALAQASKVGVGSQGAGLTIQERDSMNQTAASVSQMDKRMGAIENALSQTPDKAVALPLLKQQVSDLQDRMRGDLDGVRGEISHLYTMLEWLLGLIITIIIGMGGLVVNSVRQSGGKKDDPPSEMSVVKTAPTKP